MSEVYSGLPEDVVFCKRCVISNQRPSSTVEFKHKKDEKKQLAIVTQQNQLPLIENINLDNVKQLYIAALVPGIYIDPSWIDNIRQQTGIDIEVFSVDNSSFGISEIDISEIATKISHYYLQKLALSDTKYIEERQIISSLGNMFGLALHPLVSLLLRLDVLVKEQHFSHVYVFGNNYKKMVVPERPDVKFLYSNEAAFSPLIIDFLEGRGLKYSIIKTSSVLKNNLLTSLRHYILLLYKLGMTITRDRSKNIRTVNNKVTKPIFIIIRAESEYWSIKPVLEKLKVASIDTCIIQDDLIKNPSSLRVLTNNNEAFSTIHTGIGCWKIIKRWCRAIIARKAISNTSFSCVDQACIEQVGVSRMLLTNHCFKAIVDSVSASLPEMLHFKRQLDYHIKQQSPSAIVTMDMVDQWSAITGIIGNSEDIPTFTLQNASLDKIIYPQPVSTRYMWVSNKYVKDLLLFSEPRDGAIKITGLPVQDDIFQKTQNKLLKKKQLIEKLDLPENQNVILTATQPFVQSYPYNKVLIETLLELAEAQKSIKLLIKPHPRENIELYREYEKYSSVKVVDSDNILELFAVADIMVSRTSTSMASSVLFGVPTIAFLENYPLSICDRLDYLSSNVTKKSISKEELKTECMRILDDGEQGIAAKNAFLSARDTYMELYVGAPQGDASDKIIQHITHCTSSD